MRSALSLLLASLLLAPPALADEAVDLRRSEGYPPKVGDRVRHTKMDRQQVDTAMLNGGAPVQQKREEKGYDAVWLDEVQAVSEDGKRPTRTLRTYERFKDLRKGGGDVPVEGVKVLISADAAGVYSFAPAEGSAPVPPAVEARLREENQKATNKAKGGAGEAKELLLPAEPQQVGATWSVDPATVAASMGICKAEDVVADASKVTGTFVSLEERDGVRWAKVKVEMRFALRKIKELLCPEPAQVDTTIELTLPAGGETPAGEMTSRSAIKAKPAPPNMPQGMSMTVEVTNEGTERRERDAR